tara:strand:+ start:849 stop:980 length:132 start_codon:yes stop_codon:yes gene_type:complete
MNWAFSAYKDSKIWRSVSEIYLEKPSSNDQTEGYPKLFKIRIY